MNPLIILLFCCPPQDVTNNHLEPQKDEHSEGEIFPDYFNYKKDEK